MKLFEKRAPKGLQKADSEKGVAPLGRLLGHLWFPSRFLTRKMSPRRPQSVPGTGNYLTNDPQSVTNYSKSAPESEFVGDSDTELQIWTSGPADCAKRFE